MCTVNKIFPILSFTKTVLQKNKNIWGNSLCAQTELCAKGVGTTIVGTVKTARQKFDFVQLTATLF